MKKVEKVFNKFCREFNFSSISKSLLNKILFSIFLTNAFDSSVFAESLNSQKIPVNSLNLVRISSQQSQQINDLSERMVVFQNILTTLAATPKVSLAQDKQNYLRPSAIENWLKESNEFFEQNKILPNCEIFNKPLANMDSFAYSTNEDIEVINKTFSICTLSYKWVKETFALHKNAITKLSNSVESMKNKNQKNLTTQLSQNKIDEVEKTLFVYLLNNQERIFTCMQKINLAKTALTSQELSDSVQKAQSLTH